METTSKVIDIYGDNYLGFTKHYREGSRAIILNEKNQILLSHETKIDRWMIPGGGIEENETPAECCIREAGEETGLVINTGECILVMNEYYEDWLFVSNFFVCTETGNVTEMHLTEREADIGAVPEWIDYEEAKAMFSRFPEYDGLDEERRGIYQREYIALQVFDEWRAGKTGK